MTGQSVVTVEWAQHGKLPNERAGYHLLASSDGVLGSRNFADALDRFALGTPQALPQVSVSFVARADQPDGTYIALAIHEYLAGHVDKTGRKIAYTRYFCAPYRELAVDGISYGAMYEAYRNVVLPAPDGKPLRLALQAVPVMVPPPDDVTLRVAALLLTGRPVCVLGAEQAMVCDRLAFIDAVMALLPYGMRSRMSAATWTKATAPHRFRLSFSDGAREGREDRAADLVAYWGNPESTAIPQEYPFAHDYLEWLRDRVQQPVNKLAGLTDEAGFGAKRVVQMLEGAIGIMGLAGEPGSPGGPVDMLHAEIVPARGSGGFAERILAGINDLVAAQDIAGLRRDLAALQNFLTRPRDSGSRAFCLNLIFRCQLLRPELGPLLRRAKLATKYYATMLRLGFGLPLDYQGYCELESCLGTGSPPEPPPQPELLEAIRREGIADPRVAVMVHHYLGSSALQEWFRSGRVDLVELVGRLAGSWKRDDHARVACEVTRQYLLALRGQYDPLALRRVLRVHGYLGDALHRRHPDAPGYQLGVLLDLVACAHGDRLAEDDVLEILADGELPPTAALLAAVLLLADPERPQCADLARQAFVTSVLLGTDFGLGMDSTLRRFVPEQFLHYLRAAAAGQAVTRPMIEQGRAASLPVADQAAARLQQLPPPAPAPGPRPRWRSPWMPRVVHRQRPQ